MKEILDKILSGEATQEEIRAFLKAAQADRSLAHTLSRHRALGAMLGVAMEPEDRRTKLHDSVMDALDALDDEHFTRMVIRRVEWPRRMRHLLAIAAVLLLSLGAWWMMKPRHHQTITILRMESISGADQELKAGLHLTSKQRLRFAKGLMEVEVGGKGRMILEGPVDIGFPTPNRSSIRHGKLVMRVHPEGHGYIVSTPQGEIKDLGTEFGISVKPTGESGVYVIDGAVEVKPHGGKTEILERTEAMELARGGRRMKGSPGDFYTSLAPVRTEPVNFVHWPLDETSSDFLLSRGGDHDSLTSRSLQLLTDGSTRPTSRPGVFGSSLAFDGKGGFAKSDFQGFGPNRSQTICLWVKVPEDAAEEEGLALLSWGRFQVPRAWQLWQISVNPFIGDGELGRLRFGTPGAQIVGTRDLRDGEWHHVAVVLYGGSRPENGDQVLIYIDGMMEPLSGRNVTPIIAESDISAHRVWVGRNISGFKFPAAQKSGGFFRGMIDEIYIFDAALTQPEINRLRTTNTFHE